MLEKLLFKMQNNQYLWRCVLALALVYKSLFFKLGENRMYALLNANYLIFLG